MTLTLLLAAIEDHSYVVLCICTYRTQHTVCTVGVVPAVVAIRVAYRSASVCKSAKMTARHFHRQSASDVLPGLMTSTDRVNYRLGTLYSSLMAIGQTLKRKTQKPLSLFHCSLPVIMFLTSNLYSWLLL